MKDDGFLDLSDHDSFSMGVPHLTFERLRKEDPIFWTKEKNGRGFWSILRVFMDPSMGPQPHC